MTRSFNHPLVAQVKRDFFPLDSPIQIDLSIEGQGIDDEGRYIIGPWAGPEPEMPNLFHEMGHFADREKDKLEEFPNLGWGYGQGKFWQIGTSWGYEPQTDQSVIREARCWAYQISLMRHYGLETDVSEVVASAVWLPAFFLYKQPACKDDKSRLSALAEEVNGLSQTTHSFDAFREAWFDRLRHLTGKRQLQTC